MNFKKFELHLLEYSELSNKRPFKYDLNSPDQNIDILSDSKLDDFLNFLEITLLEECRIMGNYVIEELENELQRIKKFGQTINQRAFSNRENFIKDAQKYVNELSDLKEPVFFVSSVPPDYSQMTKKQLKYYFYVRSLLKRNTVDISIYHAYIFLYLFELLTKVGSESTLEAYEKINFIIHKVFKKIFSGKIEKFLPLVIDFSIENNFPVDLSEYEFYDMGNDDFLVNSTLNLSKEKGKAKILSDLVIDLIPEAFDNVFWVMQAKKDDYRMLENVFSEVDRYLKETKGKGLFEIYGPENKKTYSRVLYMNTPIAIEEPVKIELKDFYGSDNFKNIVKSIIKITENTLRKHYNIYNNEVSGVEIDSELEKVITDYINEILD